MECDAIRRSFIESRSLTDAEREHARCCAGCQQLVADHDELGLALSDMAARPSDSVSDDLLSSVVAEVEHERRPRAFLRNLATPARLAVALAVTAGVVAAAGLAKTRADFSVYPEARMILVLSLLVLGLAAAISRALRPLHVPAPSPARLALLAAAALGLPFVLGVLPAAHLAHAASTEGMGADFVSRAAACFGYGSVVAIPLLVALALLDRSDGTDRTVVVLTAAASGLLGNLVLQLHCPITHPEHVVAGHATIGLGFVLAYSLARARRWRARHALSGER